MYMTSKAISLGESWSLGYHWRFGVRWQPWRGSSTSNSSQQAAFMKLNRLKIEYNLHILPPETGRETLNVCLHQSNVWVHCRPGQLVYSGHEYTFWGDTSKPYQVTVIVFVTYVMMEIMLLLLMAMVVVIRTRMITVSRWLNQEFKQHMEDRQTFVREAGHQYSVWKPIQKLISLQ